MAQEVECQVLEVDARAKRISLGLKQLEPDPWSLFTDKYKPGDKIGGKVRSLTDYGVFVGIEEGVDGMVHKTDLSWTVKINNPADLYAKGDDVEAIILSINHDEKKVSLGVKQLWDDPWGEILELYKPGTVIDEVTVLSSTDYGAFVRVKEGIEALIPSNEIPPGVELTAGQVVKAEVSNIDTMDRRVTMSLRNPGGSPQAEQLQVLKRETSGKTATLGDVLKEKLGDKLQSMAAPAAEAAEAEPAADESSEPAAEESSEPAEESSEPAAEPAAEDEPAGE
jgi:small subunit ribosomal protein S1